MITARSKDPADRPASAGTFGNMLGVQLEPAGALFRRATVLMIDRLGLFLKMVRSHAHRCLRYARW